MSEKERLQLEQECLLKYSKAQMIEKYIDVFEENGKLSELWCKNNKILTELEEWLKEPEYFNGRKLRQDYITVMTTDVLNKIQKLKEKYK